MQMLVVLLSAPTGLVVGAAAVSAAVLLVAFLPLAWRFLEFLLASAVARRRRGIASIPGPKGVPLLGNFSGHQQVCSWMQTFGPLFKINYPIAAIVVLTDPEAITNLCRILKIPKGTLAYQAGGLITRPASPNIFSVGETPYWRAVRKAVTPAFSTANLKRFLPTVVDLSLKVAEHLRAQGSSQPLDMGMATRCLTIDVIGRFMYDRDLHATDFTRNELGEVMCQLMVGMQDMFNPLNVWFPWRKEARSFARVSGRFSALLDGMVADMRACPPAPHCLMAHLMGMTNPDTGRPLSADSLRSEVGVFMAAGLETTGHAISWTLMYIAAHKEVEARIASELSSLGLLACAALPEPPAPAWGQLGELRYLNAVINEGLRLMPPTSGGTTKMVPPGEPISVLGHTLPPGTLVWMNAYATHRSERNWPDAGEFRPERWLDGDQRQPPAAAGQGGARGEAEDEVVTAACTNTARGWIPFSEGPRNCVGMSLALLELRVFLAMVCSRFTFRLAEEMGGVKAVEQEARQYITLQPGPKGLLIHATPRVPR